jgi:PDZ domain-containing protein
MPITVPNQKLPRPAVLIVVLFLVVSVFAPLPYAVVEPGGGRNVLGSIIQISDEKTYPSSGKLLLTTVYATSPESTLFAGNILRAWYHGESIVVPRAVLYPPKSTPKEIDAQNTKEMVGSQQDATAAALTYLGYEVLTERIKDSTGKEIVKFNFPFDVNITLKNTGGPSGGLVFALGIIEKLTPEDVLKGRVVAGTGTINKAGRIGPIGGVDEKLIAAKRAGATLFLAPTENCDDITHVPAGITVYSVSTLAEAVSVLKDSTKSIPHCTWQRIR